MDDTESSPETATQTNGTVPPPVEEGSAADVKPWIAAGFKTRDAMREAQGHKTAKPKAKKPKMKVKAASKSVKKPKLTKKSKKSKKSKKPKLTAKGAKKVKKPKAKKPAKVKASAKGSKKALKKADRKYTPILKEPSAKHKKLLAAFGGLGKKVDLSYVGKKAWPSLSAKKAFSWARNCARWLFANKYLAHTGPGEYKRLK